METGRVSDKIWFYNEGLGDKDGPNNRNWSIKTLSTFRKELKHEDVSMTLDNRIRTEQKKKRNIKLAKV